MKLIEKHVHFCILIILIFGSCQKKTNFYQTCNSITLNQPVDSLLKAFIEENYSIDCQYYLISYLSCGQRIVTFIANNVGDRYYLREKSLAYFFMDGKKIYLITGIEDFFRKGIEKNNEKQLEKKSPFSNIKSYIIERDKIEFVPHGIPPFAPPPSLMMENDSLSSPN
jgi:hypothetical protein